MKKKKRDNLLITTTEPSSIITEAYRSIRTSLKYASFDEGRKAILLTSSVQGEGKTSIVSNLGILFAQDQKKVLLIDGDLRRPNLHYIFRINNRSGVSSILTGYSSLEETVISTEIDNLSVLPAGPIQPNAAELLGSIRMDQLIEQCKNQFDIVLIDAPPILAVTDANIIARVSDGIVFVIRSMYTKKDQLVKAQKILHPFKEKVLGVIMNDRVGEN